MKNLQSKICNLKLPYFYIALGILFLIFAALFHPFDIEYKNALQEIRAAHSRYNILDIIRIMGKGEFIIFVALLLGAVKYKALACKIILALLIVTVIVWSLKIPVQRERPNHGDFFSFPSGDSAVSASLSVSITPQIPVLAIPGAISAGAVAFLRNYDNCHYLSDVLVGIGFGVISAGLSMFIKLRRFRLFWKIKPILFRELYGVLFLLYVLPWFFKWAFMVWLFSGSILILIYTIREKKS